MKKLSVFVVLFLFFYSALEAQTIFDSVTVVTDESAPSVNLISNDSQSLMDIHCHAIKISNESSHDVIINGATFSCSSLYTESRLEMYNISITTGTILIGKNYFWSINNIDGYRDLDFSFFNPVIIPSHSSIIINLRSQLYGWGQFVFSLRKVIFTDAETFETEAVKYWGNSVIGKDITLANTDHLNIHLGVYPRGWNHAYEDTLYVLPGEFFYSSAYGETDKSNFLPLAITVFRSRVIISENLLNSEYFSFLSPQSLYYWQDRGTVTISLLPLDQVLIWTANSVDYGVDDFPLSWVSGYSNLPLGEIANINFYSDVVFCNSICVKPSEDFAWHNRILKSVDGILGDFTGNGLVDQDDLTEMQTIFTNNGGFNDLYHYTKEGWNVGRAEIFFGYPSFIDLLALSTYINDPSSPFVKDLGIGQLMSKRTKLTPATYSETRTGSVVKIKTFGFAVQISAILPSGKLWSNSAIVSDYQTEFTIPEGIINYRIEAVSLPNSTTGVENNLSTPIEFNLSQNYPNPFNPSTAISYSIPKSSFVNLKIYDILGKEVATLVNEEKAEGNYSVNFDGSKLASGTYLCRLVSGAFSQTKKMVLMK